MSPPTFDCFHHPSSSLQAWPISLLVLHICLTLRGIVTKTYINLLHCLGHAFVVSSATATILTQGRDYADLLSTFQQRAATSRRAVIGAAGSRAPSIKCSGSVAHSRLLIPARRKIIFTPSTPTTYSSPRNRWARSRNHFLISLIEYLHDLCLWL